MVKISENEKIILAYLVTNCEFYHLTEEESLDYIRFNFSKPISRRTFYNYKSMIYDNYSPFPNNKPEKREEICLRKQIRFQSNHLHNRKKLGVFSLLRAKYDITKKAEERNIPLEDFDKLNFIPSHFPNTLENVNSFFKQTEMSLEGYKMRADRRIKNNLESIPDNVTIRSEYVKCGKDECSSCKHGPYYYGYWRDEEGKLKKKYIGLVPIT